jgi:hypothetical protein
MPLFDINYNKRNKLWEIDTDEKEILEMLDKLEQVTGCLYNTEQDTWIVLKRDTIYDAFIEAHGLIKAYLGETI